MDKLLVIRHIKVEGANAIAGLTWGFPSMTSFLGLTHALQRKVQTKVSERLALNGCAVICHSSQVQSHSNNMSRENYFALTRNPLTKDGSTAPFNEEGKMRMDISLLIKLYGPTPPEIEDTLVEFIEEALLASRVAGGAVLSIDEIELITDIGAINRERSTRKSFLRKLLPGFALISRDDVLQDHIQKSQKAPLDAFLDFSIRKMSSKGKGDKAEWTTNRLEYTGWLKPIMVGYQGISDVYEAGQVEHVRDRSCPVQFVESIYSLGQWISPHRIDDLKHLFWHQEYQASNALYLCKNDYQPDTPILLNDETNQTIEEK
ncbi:type I-F CRISPR-associated protein Csy2 [Marinomonas sp. M1K-6]|uniref:Type I-F CRISPR-associated protein Csy2 n=1 Tax=Marinomonas profundi TaxID=2726122 RepID=A0A847RBY0_9GAMM|nr:type I-F CRISPR-associated protein Csy2 [Marinomonas profundi]NLQ18777.1 type I-F CRISPR-associated protein Csy2 [Marinomonas profundi]UDV02288.1 type I-F CRISPR-associated protein Csy2 [Marinomonas profundi]